MKTFRLPSMLAALLVLATAFQAMANPLPLTLSPFQHKKAQTRLAGMSAADKGRFQRLLSQSRNINEQRYITKALAVGHNMQGIESFAATIRGKDSTWMRDNLHLTNNSRGLGIQQHWQDSCGPTTYLAACGELDPIFALRYRGQTNQAALQKQLLERAYSGGGAGGVAVPRGGQGGRGRWIEDLLNNETRNTGVRYTLKHLQGSYTMDRALAELDAALAWGVPVAVVAQAPAGSSHYCLATARYNASGQKCYLIHDPWTGQTSGRTEAQFRQNRLDLSGNTKLIALSMPSW